MNINTNLKLKVSIFLLWLFRNAGGHGCLGLLQPFLEVPAVLLLPLQPFFDPLQFLMVPFLPVPAFSFVLSEFVGQRPEPLLKGGNAVVPLLELRPKELLHLGDLELCEFAFVHRLPL